MNKEEFLQELIKLNIKLTQSQQESLETYYNILCEENKKYNLTSITDKNLVYLKHFYDSLTIVKAIKLENQYLCDIGTGAGFPGIILKIVFPNLKVDLLDSTTKKCQFLENIIKELKLKNIRVINERAENYSKKHREIYDVVTSRAVAPLKHLLEYSVPLLKVNGIFISLKSNIEEELINIDNYYQKLCLSDEDIISFFLPKENSYRTIFKVRKTGKTKNIYPRTYIQIKKKGI